jgi:hypothetical protein
MKNLKTYQYGNIQYGYSLQAKGWKFDAPGYSLIRHCKGSEVAHKVAHIYNGAILRCGHLDNLARANINKLTIS